MTSGWNNTEASEVLHFLESNDSADPVVFGNSYLNFKILKSLLCSFCYVTSGATKTVAELLFGVGVLGWGCYVGRGCFCFFPYSGGVKPCTWKKVKFVREFLLQ